mgnify:FL=1|jgi:sRNA-binding carbon storage regulator CsrA
MLSIRIKDGERIQVGHGGVTAWVTVVKDGPYIRLLVDGPRQIKVLRESLVIPDTVPVTNVA